MPSPGNAKDWLRYPFWVDWIMPGWVDEDLNRSDWASRAFNNRELAQEFASENLGEKAWVLFYERSNDENDQSFFIYAQQNCADQFEENAPLNEIRSGFGFRWTDGETEEMPETYTPYGEA